jgi:benzil reductase ((S)-benzoin forming)
MKRKIFITGVSSGIGYALAQMYLDQGNEVYGVSRRAPSDLLIRPNFLFQWLDLSQLEKLRSALAELLAAHPGLDLAILNAAVVGNLSDISETTIAELDEVMTVNVSGNKVVLDCLFELCPRVAQVVAVSSRGAVKAARGTPAYCLSKAALNMLIALYAEERPKTHFSAVAPWIVNTEMQEVLIRKAGDPRFPALSFLEQMRDAGEM